MPRANRFFHPGTIWHVTHRCHNREFLLKFEKDRQRWKHWLYQARKRYGMSILNYIATSNHIHLLLRDCGNNDIPHGMQLVASRVAQEYNRRKSRAGAFWEDRYFATAICTDEHLMRCLVYIDLNMVRAGQVTHPASWKVSGYNEIQSPPKRYGIIDKAGVQRLFGCRNWNEFRCRHRDRVASRLESHKMCRESIWTDSVAVGPENFVSEFKAKLGVRAHYRRKEESRPGTWVLNDSII